MWSEKEIERIGKTFINSSARLEDYLDKDDIEAIKEQGITYFNLKDKIFRPKVLLNSK